MSNDAKRLDEIAHAVMATLIQRQILKHFGKTNELCEDELECIVSKFMDSDKAKFEVLRKSLSFKNFNEFDEEYDRIVNEVNSTSNFDKGISNAIKSNNPDTFNDAVKAITAPFFHLAKQREIQDLATIYAYLIGEPERINKYYPKFVDMEKLKAGSILGNLRKTAMQILDEKGLAFEWKKLSGFDKIHNDQKPGGPAL